MLLTINETALVMQLATLTRQPAPLVNAAWRKGNVRENRQAIALHVGI